MSEFFNRVPQTPIRKALRNRMTHAERILWYYLRKQYLEGYKFRRQYGIGPYVVDFYCPALRIAIEVDGDSHYRTSADEHDRQRQKFIEQQGIIVLRFTDNDVKESIEGVIEKIRVHFSPPLTPPPRGGETD